MFDEHLNCHFSLVLFVAISNLDTRVELISCWGEIMMTTHVTDSRIMTYLMMTFGEHRNSHPSIHLYVVVTNVTTSGDFVIFVAEVIQSQRATVYTRLLSLITPPVGAPKRINRLDRWVHLAPRSGDIGCGFARFFFSSLFFCLKIYYFTDMPLAIENARWRTLFKKE